MTEGADTPQALLAVEAAQPWQRLDKRMLLVHPVNEGVKILPVFLVSFFVGSRSGNHLWSLGILAVVVVFAILRWFTTSYRIGPVHVQLRRGVLHKKVLSIPRTRIRSVDVEANVLHRVLGLSILRIGTGRQADEGEAFELDALDSSLVPALRAELLARVSGPVAVAGDGAHVTGVELAHWQLSWVRFAPFSITGIVTITAAVGVLFQYGIGQTLTQSSVVTGTVDSAEQFGVAVIIVALLTALLIASSIFACVRYLLAYANLTVTDQGSTFHVSHGLLRTRQSTLDRKRLRGTSLAQPLLLRAVGGARLDAIMTGVSAQKRESSLLLPQAPNAEALRVMATVLGEAGLHGAADRPLTTHGPAARRRRYTRTLVPALALSVGLGSAQFAGARIPGSVWVAVAVIVLAATGLAHDRYRGLGHAVLPGWLITSHGSLDRTRHSLESAGIIGWTVKQSFFQRRAGVATVVAATPAGVGHYEVIDIPAKSAWAMIDAVTPGACDIWGR